MLRDAGVGVADTETASLDDAETFELAPVSLWLEDYSALKSLFDTWRADGITDLRQHLRANPDQIRACSACIRVIKVNRKTLVLYDADDLSHLTDNLSQIFRDDMHATFVEELGQLWDGQHEFHSTSANYALSGRRIDIQLRATILPGHENSWDRVLLAIEDVTERENARRKLAASEEYARGLFEHSPVSLWVEDFSSIKRLMDGLRSSGIEDFRVFTDVHPEFVEQCMAEIRVLDVNRHTLTMFAAPDRQTLLKRANEIFRDNMLAHFREQLIDLWNGKLYQTREVINYTLAGDELHVHLQFSVLPGHAGDWSLVQVALTDITPRKRAEAYLEYLGKHDALTKLRNRSFYNDEVNRLERKGIVPITVIIADLNGLKSANDALGHVAGDALLSRVGEVLDKAVAAPFHAARIGGDEFAILMPGADEREGHTLLATIAELVDLNNQYHSELELGLSLGMATSHPGERLEAVIKRADDAMYEEKRAYYARPEHERRLPSSEAV